MNVLNIIQFEIIEISRPTPISFCLVKKLCLHMCVSVCVSSILILFCALNEKEQGFPKKQENKNILTSMILYIWSLRCQSLKFRNHFAFIKA